MNLSDFQSTLLIFGLLFALIFAFGYLLKRTGKPYGTLLLTVHKLAGLGWAAGFTWAPAPAGRPRSNPWGGSGL